MNPFKVLGVHRKSYDADVRDAYYDLARVCHPDMKGGSAESFQRVRRAYALIGTREARAEFVSKAQVMWPLCLACRGTGVRTKTRSITDKDYSACAACGGAGVAITEGE